MSRTRVGVRLVVQACSGIHLHPATFDVWRAVPGPRDPQDASGSCEYVGRWHNPRTTPALYVARIRETALAECQAHLEPGAYDLTVAPFHVTIPALFDLTDGAVAGRLPFRLDRCLAPTDLGPYRGAVVGDAALTLGATALLAPCRRGPGGCLALYTICRNTITPGKPETVSVVIPE
jgi:RES domain-containing protein